MQKTLIKKNSKRDYKAYLYNHGSKMPRKIIDIILYIFMSFF